MPIKIRRMLTIRSIAIMIFRDVSKNLSRPIKLRPNSSPSPMAAPRAVINPFLNPYNAPRLNTNTKIGPIAAAAESPTRKQFLYKPKFI